MNIWRVVAILLISMPLIGSVACSPFGSGQEEIGQHLIEVVRGDLTISISGSGNIEVSEDADLTFSLGGRIDKIYVEKGDKASKGKVLARLNTDDLELALTKAEVDLTQTESAIIQAELGITQAELGVTQAELGITQAESAIIQSELGITQAELGVTQAESAIIQSELGVIQAELGITQAESAITQAELGITQAELALEIAKYNLDRMEDVAEAKDAITDAEYQVKIAEARLKEVNYLGDNNLISYWRTEVIIAKLALAKAQQELADLLAEPNYADLVVDEVIVKQLQVEAAEQSLEQTEQTLTQAQQTLKQAQQELKQAQQNLEQTQQTLTQAQQTLTQARQELELAQQTLELAQQEPELARQTLTQAQQEPELARQTLELAQQTLKQTQQALKLAQQSVEYAQNQLAEATLTATFGGTVASIFIDEGDTVLATTPIMHLVDQTTMELEVEMDEIDIPDVKLMQKVIITADALPDAQLEGMVTFISPLAREESGLVLYGVIIDFDVPKGFGLRAGMSATAEVVLDDRSNVLLIPERAISKDSQGNLVVEVVINEQTEKRPVIIGLSDGFETEIIDGLKEGEVIVLEARTR